MYCNNKVAYRRKQYIKRVLYAKTYHFAPLLFVRIFPQI